METKQLEFASSSSSSTKVERKIIEKNRRNHMKNLYSTLNSLIPKQPSKQEALPLPDQIDEAINYIRSLETKLKECRKKKERLMMMGEKKRSYASIRDKTAEAMADMASSSSSSSKASKIEIHEMGSNNLQVILTSGVDDRFIFYEVTRILHEDGAEILYANFSVVGNEVVHVIHAEIRDTTFGIGAAKIIIERLKRFVNGSSTSDVELQLPELWDTEIDQRLWEFWWDQS